jgi:predicted  nucleic acid-binding Zn-ribbon protein
MASETIVLEERLELSAEDVQRLSDILDRIIVAAEETVERLDRTRLDRAESEIRRLQDDMRTTQRDVADLRACMAALEERFNTARAEMRTEFTQVVAEMQLAVIKAQATKPALPSESPSTE